MMNGLSWVFGGGRGVGTWGEGMGTRDGGRGNGAGGGGLGGDEMIGIGAGLGGEEVTGAGLGGDGVCVRRAVVCSVSLKLSARGCGAARGRWRGASEGEASWELDDMVGTLNFTRAGQRVRGE